MPASQVLTGEAQLVNEAGEVFMHGRQVGTTTPHRPGWAAWGLEAAGAPFNPPPYGVRPIEGRRRVEDDRRAAAVPVSAEVQHAR